MKKTDKKYVSIYVFMITMFILILGCTGYNNSVDKSVGKFDLKVSENGKRGFVFAYNWSGDPADNVITFPKTDGQKADIESLGGVIGIGVPCPFHIELDGNEVDCVSENPDDYEFPVTFENMIFELKIGDNIKDVTTNLYSPSAVNPYSYIGISQPDGSVIFYRILVTVDCDPANPYYYSQDGELYITRDGSRVTLPYESTLESHYGSDSEEDSEENSEITEDGSESVSEEDSQLEEDGSEDALEKDSESEETSEKVSGAEEGNPEDSSEKASETAQDKTTDNPEDVSGETGQGNENILNASTVGENTSVTYGIDVSKYQGDIDWAKVAATGIDFAIIRAGFRDPGSAYIGADSYAEKNLREATDNGIKVGVYFFSTAATVAEAQEEADWLADLLAPYSITYPVGYDCEGFDKNRQAGLTQEERTNVAMAFMNRIYERGYTPMFYSAVENLKNDAKWDTSRLQKKYKMWVAKYDQDTQDYAAGPDYPGACAMWQYSCHSRIDGVYNAEVDRNAAFFGYDGTEPPKAGANP